ncbi:MAG: cytochrome c peroxidase [Planctomycetota bacterium]
MLSANASAQTLPSVPVPSENPITEPKRVLGKILFWDEQLSSDNITACGTCHIPSAAGTEPRFGVNPGPDLTFVTPDDIFGSPGIPKADADGRYVVDASFGTGVQVTGRSAPTMINAAYAFDLFWDGRATGQFTDPETGSVAIAFEGALESQAVGPPLSDVEMGHPGRDWAMISSKLASARPLALATDLPLDVEAAIDSFPTYPDLFAEAFGDGTINARRIAFAIATYERTLISDQSPWDAFQLGDASALTPEEVQGWQVFQGSTCGICHVPPLFTDQSFRNIGVRPNNEDTGRQGVTGQPFDSGAFKTPSLRNVGLKSSFMHNGEFVTLQEVLNFYALPPGPGRFNVDPFIPSPIPPPDRGAVAAFLGTGLLDPRVANETFPFDRPTLRSELAANPVVTGAGVPDTSGTVPAMLVDNPPLAGSDGFRLGVTGIADGAQVELLISSVAPVGSVLTAEETVGPLTASLNGGTEPVATAFWPVPDDPTLDGLVLYFQWFVPATGARSAVAEATIFCGTGGCSERCPGDVNADGEVTDSDFFAWVTAFVATPRSPEQEAACDVNRDSTCTDSDFFAWVTAFVNGC